MMKVPYIVKLDLPADVSLLHLLRECLDEAVGQIDGLENAGKIANQLKLAVHEVCANVMEHGYAEKKGRIKVIVTVNDDQQNLIVELIDYAEDAFHPNLSESNAELEATRGRGLLLVAGLLDEVSYMPAFGQGWRFMDGGWVEMESGGGENAGNCWRLVKKLEIRN